MLRVESCQEFALIPRVYIYVQQHIKIEYFSTGMHIINTNAIVCAVTYLQENIKARKQIRIMKL